MAAAASPYDVASWGSLAFVGPALAASFPHIEAVAVEPWASSGGLTGDMFRLSLTLGTTDPTADPTASATPPSVRLVLKLTDTTKLETSRSSGLWREGTFLSLFSPQPDLGEGGGMPKSVAAFVKALQPIVPTVYYARGSEAEARKVVVMAEVVGAQTGHFFGPGSPLNWGKDLPALTACLPNVTEETVVGLVVKSSATLHARYWNNREALLPTAGEGESESAAGAAAGGDCLSFLRSRDWYAGGGRDSWQAAMDMSRGMWATARKNIDLQTGVHTFPGSDGKAAEEVQWPPALVALVDGGFERATWEAFQETDLPGRGHVTLVHGDFHPANMIMSAADRQVYVVDWEVVGCGSGPQELGQYFISHSTPESRRKLAPPALKSYSAKLFERLSPEARRGAGGGAATLAALEELVQREYVQGGLGRWLWMLPILSVVCPPPALRYFVAQVAAFVEDHPVDAATAPLPRA